MYKIGLDFDLLPDKQEAMDDLIKLTSSKEEKVRKEVLKVFTNIFQDVPDKEKLWEDLIILLKSSKFYDVRIESSKILRSVFQYQPDKQKAWEDLRKLIFDKDDYVQWNAIEILGYVFENIPDKTEAWIILRELAADKRSSTAAKSLGCAFQYIPDKKQASEDMYKLAEDEKDFVRQAVVERISYAIPYLVDKQKAWDTLVKLAFDKNNQVSYAASDQLGDAFQYASNKQKAWSDIYKMSFGQDKRVKCGIATSISTLFDFAPNRHDAWNVLHRLSCDDDIDARWYSPHSIGLVFSRLSDEEKQQAWKDIHRLVHDEIGTVRSAAAESLRYIFPQISIKYQQQASDDLHRLTLDKDSLVRRYIAESIGFLFPCLPGKTRALKDLKRLESDEHPYVSSCAYHSLGKISIYNSSQTINEFDCKKELETAIKYFEKSTERGYDLNPSQFCLPFYRSFQAIIFEGNEAEDQVQRYLTEAKRAIRDSQDKKTLYEAVKNLASALTEVQNLDFIDKKEKLNSCRKYCEIATELMKDTEKTAPYATELIRKGLPILDRKLRAVLDEIHERAKNVCKESKGTDAEEIAYAVNREVQKWKISNQEEMTLNIEVLIETFRLKMPHLPGYEHIFKEIEGIQDETDLVKQYKIVSRLIELIPIFNLMPDYVVQDIRRIKQTTDVIDKKLDLIDGKLDIIRKELNQGFEKLEILSLEIGGKQGELIKAFSKRILELTEKKDNETLDNFLEEVHKKENTLIEAIEKSPVSLEDKNESKRSILNIRSVIDRVKHPIKSFGKDITREIIVTYAAEEIVKLVFQLVSMAALGVPIPPQILNLLSSMTKELKN